MRKKENFLDFQASLANDIQFTSMILGNPVRRPPGAAAKFAPNVQKAQLLAAATIQVSSSSAGDQITPCYLKKPYHLATSCSYP